MMKTLKTMFKSLFFEKNIISKTFSSNLNCSYKDITFVTICFNMGMDKLSNVKGNQRNSYIDYYVKPLQILCNKFEDIIIFCDEECAQALRIGPNHKIIVMSFEQIERYKLYERYTNAVQNMYTKAQTPSVIFKNSDFESIALYTILNNSKIDFIKKAKDQMLFETKYAVWLDAGMAQQKYSTVWKNWKGTIDLNFETFKCCLHTKELTLHHLKSLALNDILYCYAEDQIPGGIFAVNTNFINEFHKKYNEIILDLLNMNCISSEQSILTYMLQQHPDYFSIVQSYHYDEIVNCVFTKKGIDLY